MKVLIPSNHTLISSNVPYEEYTIFSSGAIYAVGKIVIHDKRIYKRLTATETNYEEYDPSKAYKIGDVFKISTFNQVYKVLRKVRFLPPLVDVEGTLVLQDDFWEEVLVTDTFESNHEYLAGETQFFSGNAYLCNVNHTSEDLSQYIEYDRFQSSTNGSAYFTYGKCRYNGRYYKLTRPYQPGSTDAIYFPNEQLPNNWINAWEDVTSTALLPSPSSSFWTLLSNHFIDDLEYSPNEYCTVLNRLFKCILKPRGYQTLPGDGPAWMLLLTETPDKDTTAWEDLGVTNRFKMFDQYLTTQTIHDGTIEMALSADFNALFLGNIFADSLKIEVIKNSDATIVETKTVDLSIDCVDILDYFLGDWMYQRQYSYVYERTSVYQDVSLKVYLYGSRVGIGILLLGKTYHIGDEAWEAQIEALDFSTTVEDTKTGEIFLERGNELKVNSIDLWVDTERLKSVDNILKIARGIPALYIGKNENIVTYGFYRKKTEILKNPTKSLLSLEIRELL